MKPSQIIAIIANAEKRPSSKALNEISKLMSENDEKITIVAEKTVQDIDPEDVQVGISTISFRNIVIPLHSLSLETRVPHNCPVTSDDVIKGESQSFSYTKDGDEMMITLAGRELGRRFKIECAEEAVDVAATNSLNTGNQLVLSENFDVQYLVEDAASITIDENGIYLGAGDFILWNDVSAVTLQETLAIAVGRNKLMSLSES